MNVLVTGGAGYAGSVVSEELLKKGHLVIVLDNLQQGHRAAVSPQAEFVLADINDVQALDDVFSRYQIDAVIHMAAETLVEKSMKDPQKYFEANLISGISLLNAMLKHQVQNLIFSSSAAVYGNPVGSTITENQPIKPPLNVYGESKLMLERIIQRYSHAYGLKSVTFRFFNIAGANGILGEDHTPETHLIPSILKIALNGEKSVPVFGTDYPTEDGTCLRDYVHVIDIAQAHILALENLEVLNGRAYNLGSGVGHSVLEIIETVRKITGVKITSKIRPRRPGDPPVLVASTKRANSELGWKPEFSALEDIIESAWKWTKVHPVGYER